MAARAAHIMNIILICAVIGFTKATTEYAPHHVELLISDGKHARFPGSGAIVSLKHILTVAINIDGFLKWEVSHGNDAFGRGSFISQRAFVHPDFNNKTLEHNLGLIVLPKELITTPATLPVALPVFNADSPRVGDYGLVASYHGLITEKSKKSLTYGAHQVVESSKCSSEYPMIQTLQNSVCASQSQYRTCAGSQGSGFLENSHRSRTLGAILSIGEFWDDCTKCNHLIYLRVSPYVNWIRRNTI